MTLLPIKPCPFCGGPAVIEEVGDGASVRFSVGCQEDSDRTDICMGYQSLTTFDRRSDAIAAWNKRTPAKPCEHNWQVWPETDGQEERCLNCGEYRRAAR